MSEKKGCPTGTKKIKGKCVKLIEYEVAKSYLVVEIHYVEATNPKDAKKMVMEGLSTATDIDQMDYEFDVN